eukprot:PRCOL_00005754-RA
MGCNLGSKSGISAALARPVGQPQRERYAIDLTAGNGYDTLKLAQLCCCEGAHNAPERAGGEVGGGDDGGDHVLVHAFDVSPDAVAATQQRLADALPARARARVRVHARCHSELADALPVSRRGVAHLSAVVANLGYLPGKFSDDGQHTRPAATQAHTTLRAVSEAARHLAPNGVMVITCYLRHDGGAEEHAALAEWARGLPAKEWRCVWLDVANRTGAPKVLALQRL